MPAATWRLPPTGQDGEQPTQRPGACHALMFGKALKDREAASFRSWSTPPGMEQDVGGGCVPELRRKTPKDTEWAWPPGADA